MNICLFIFRTFNLNFLYYNYK